MELIKVLGRPLLIFFACCICRQESEVVYCGRLSLVADLLQGLFKDAYTLQKALLELLEKIPLNSSASEEEISDIVSGARFFLHADICWFSLLNVFSLSYWISDSQPA